MPRMLSGVAAAVLLVLGTSFCCWGQDAEADDFDARITEELRAADPEAVEVFERANAARDAGEIASAESLYREVLQLAPAFHHAKRRLAGVVLQQGRRDEAIALVHEALDTAVTPENRFVLMMTLVQDNGDSEPARAEIETALGIARELLGDPQTETWMLPSITHTAFVGQDEALAREAVATLEARSPDDPATGYFTWILAMSDGDHAGAVAALERARAAGLPDELYAEMLADTNAARALWPRVASLGATIGAVWLGGLLLLLLAGSVLSRIALKVARRPARTQSGESAGMDAQLRAAYKTVLWLSCAYYYVSIPLVLLLVLALGGGLIYAFFAIGRIPIKLVVLIAALVFVTLWAMLKSLLIRARDTDPGHRLDLAAHPRMRQVLDSVAEKIGTHAVDNVYMTPGTDLAVMERGGMLKQLRGGTERCLILGAGVLEQMKMAPFMAILAHEYGHFSNRDTAGGGFALAVRRSLTSMAYALAEGGAAAWYNPAWLFLNGFYRIFMRISQGASRLQEVLADRWAAFTYGAEAFERGLRHVIERSIRFEANSSSTLSEVIEEGKPLANLYAHRPAKPVDEEELARAVQEAMSAEPSPYDSHPSPSERFELVRGLGASGAADVEDGDADVWTLFRNRGEIERWMTEKVRESIQANHAVRIASA